jgi:alkane 1-monooxygenase
MKPYRYFLAFVLPASSLVALYNQGLWSYSTLILAFVLIPLVELFTKPDLSEHLNEEDGTKNSSLFIYDIFLYAMVPLQYLSLIWYLNAIILDIPTWVKTGLTLSMGVQCGAVGINIAHELGHRNSFFDRTLARILLLSSLYMHFIVEHNRGHHRHVATPLDPASARLNETIYTFWWRTITGSFLSAWNIAKNIQKKNGYATWHFKNEMVQAIIIQLTAILLVYLTLGHIAVLYFLGVSIIGILLLETVNYIEHYGLKRKLQPNGQYERVQPWHSWNSDYPLGRIILFELTRHSDHHYKSSKKYPTLRHIPESPQLPTGYPGMMLLSLIPPLWFRVINPKVKALNP